MNPTYVTHLETNVKSKRAVSYDFGPCTLVTGLNGTGKSAIIDAISLALTGESRSVGLKKQKSLLMRLAPPGPPGATKRELYARAKLADGNEARFSLNGNDQEWVSGWAEGGGAASAVIFTDVARDLLYGDAKALVEAIARSTNAVIFRDALENEVTRGVLPLFNDIWVNDCGLDNKLERTIGDVEKALHATQARIKTASALKRTAKTSTALTAPLNEDEDLELVAAERVLVALRSGQALEGLRDALSDMPPYNPEEHAKLSARRVVLENSLSTLRLIGENAAKDKDSLLCPCCGKHSILRAEIAMRREKLSAALGRVDANSVRFAEAESHHDLYAAVAGFLKRNMTVGDLQARRAELLRRKESAAAEPVRAAVKAVTEEEISQLDTIEAVCREAIKKATDQQLGTVERRINRALPKDIRARIVSEGGYRLELVKGKDELARDFRAISGAERALLLSAFASATIPNGAPPVRLLVVDETWLDPKSMRALLKSLVKVVGTETGPSQAIVCAVNWKGKAIDGWSEIKLDSQEGSDQTVGAEEE